MARPRGRGGRPLPEAGARPTVARTASGPDRAVHRSAGHVACQRIRVSPLPLAVAVGADGSRHLGGRSPKPGQLGQPRVSEQTRGNHRCRKPAGRHGPPRRPPVVVVRRAPRRRVLSMGDSNLDAQSGGRERSSVGRSGSAHEAEAHPHHDVGLRRRLRRVDRRRRTGEPTGSRHPRWLPRHVPAELQSQRLPCGSSSASGCRIAAGIGSTSFLAVSHSERDCRSSESSAASTCRHDLKNRHNCMDLSGSQP